MPSPFTLGTRAKSPVVSTVSRNPALACYRGPEAEDSRRPRPWARGCRFPTVGPRLRIAVALYRGHEGEDPRRLLPWARGRRFPSPFTVGTMPKIPVALYRGHEAEDSRRPLPSVRGRSPVVFTVSRRTVGTRAGIPVVSTVSRNSALAFYRGDEGEDSRRPLPWARGRRFPSPFTVGTRLRIAVALYRGPEAVDSRPWARG